MLNILNENGFYVNFISVYINMLSNTHKEMDGMREHFGSYATECTAKQMKVSLNRILNFFNKFR